MTAPFASYMICGTPRSGSTLLCGLLEDAGCGRPHSYFRRQSIAKIAHDLNLPGGDDIDSAGFNRRYLTAVLTEGRGTSEIFGLRVMFETLEELSARLDGMFPGLKGAPERFERAFGQLAYIYLSREDKVAQAISLLKATQSGLWHRSADGSELQRTAPHQDPAYDPGMIRTLVSQLTFQDEAWRRWFDVHGIEPVRLTYSALSQDPRGGLRAVLSGLGLDTSIAASVMPRTARMADNRSEDWIARFQADKA